MKKPPSKKVALSQSRFDGRHEEFTAKDTGHQARKHANLGSARSDCIRIIMRIVGEGGVSSFLTSQQPALGDRTGAQLLQDDPMELLRHLKWLEAQNDGFDEELVGDAGIEHFGRQRRKSQADRVLEILDEIAVEKLRSENYEERGSQ
jgi:hypothetical protein